MTHQPSARRQLQALYDQVPAVDCRGKCWNSCTSFPIPRIEKRHIRRATGVDLGPRHSDPRTTCCPLLTITGQCSAYDVRPLICRIWGASQLHPCNYGCRPVDPPLTMRETYRLIAQAYRISGQDSTAHMIQHIIDLPDDVLDRMTPTVIGFISGTLTERQMLRRIADQADKDDRT